MTTMAAAWCPRSRSRRAASSRASRCAGHRLRGALPSADLTRIVTDARPSHPCSARCRTRWRVGSPTSRRRGGSRWFESSCRSRRRSGDAAALRGSVRRSPARGGVARLRARRTARSESSSSRGTPGRFGAVCVAVHRLVKHRGLDEAVLAAHVAGVSDLDDQGDIWTDHGNSPGRLGRDRSSSAPQAAVRQIRACARTSARAALRNAVASMATSAYGFPQNSYWRRVAGNVQKSSRYHRER